MTELTLSSKDPAKADADALVVGVASTGDPAHPVEPIAAEHLPAALRRELAATARLLGLTGAPDEVRRIPAGDAVRASTVVLTGVGPQRDDHPAETLRRAAGAALRELRGVESVALALPAHSAEELAATVEGALLGAYAFDRYRSGRSDTERRHDGEQHIVVLTPLSRSAAAKDSVQRALVLAQAVHEVRDLVNTPPNDLYPAAFADRARTLAKSAPVKVSVLDTKALESGGFGGLVAVGQGSRRGPHLVKLVYAPSRPRAKVALVGKGITFDSGGISLKPAKGMEAMKSDMAGAAAVLATVLAAARRGLPVAVTGWLCLAENMPSGTAQRPSDVIVVKGGTTVEVLNTDAEGRLVLADGLVSAVEERPDLVVDVATLTGAQVVALGTRVSAVLGTDDAREEVLRAARASGEQFWPMPLPTELRASLDSKVADIANIGERMGGMLVAGLFLQEFVGSTPWAHLDIAGPAFNEGAPHGYTPLGGTGVGVLTLLSLLEARAG